MDTSHLNEQVDGYPSFIRWSANTGTTLNWWAPTRTGDDDLDFATGVAHFRSLMDVLQRLQGSHRDFGFSFLAPGGIDPRIALSSVVTAMTTSGQMETGFLNALAEKAYFGRAPSVSGLSNPAEEFAYGEQCALATIDLARLGASPAIIASELIIQVENMTDRTTVSGFAWVVCSAALAGALH